MPEIPDLVYIRNYLTSHIVGRTVASVTVREPILLRVMTEGTPSDLLIGRTVQSLSLHGPFLRFEFSPPMLLVCNLMLAGRLQHQRRKEKPEGHVCLSLTFDDETALNLSDEKKMAKVYLVPPDRLSDVPAYVKQGVDILSPDFSRESHHALAGRHGRKQVRVFLNDHSIFSAIGNAYADEILFEARLHPKTLVARLTASERDNLYDAIRAVIERGIAQVAAAGQPIQVKVRGHMLVRNRQGEPCPRCGTTIRRAGVRGYDVFFCPSCQPTTRAVFVDWRSLPAENYPPKKSEGIEKDKQ